MAETGPFERLWNRLIDEISRSTISSVAPPLMLSGGDVGGLRLGYNTPHLVLSSTAGFSGYCYIRGQFTDLTAATAKAWVKVKLDTCTAEYSDGPPPLPFPPFEVWYEVANTVGNIVVPT